MSLLLELQELRESKKLADTTLLVESVDKMLGHLFTDLSHGEQSLEKVDTKELATQIAGLIILAKADTREALDDFSKVDDQRVSRKFFKFLSELDENNQPRDFAEGLTADKFLQYVGTTHAKSKIEAWSKTIEDAKNGDEPSFTHLKEMIKKMHSHYSDILKKLKFRFDGKQPVATEDEFDTD